MLKRLIEVALPLKEVSEQSAREKSIRHGHISTLHIWWARRPLAACRAAVFASLIPDPDDPECPTEFRELVTKLLGPGDHREQFRPKNGDGSTVADTPRNRCLEFIKYLVRWENSNKPEYIEPARKLIAAAHKFLHPDAAGDAPKVLDPFAGGGAIPLEALRLGCEAHAIDLNPVAHLIELCTLVYPQKYGQPDSRPVPDYIKRLNQKRRAESREGRALFAETDEEAPALDSGLSTLDSDEIVPDVEITEAEYRQNPLAADVKYWGHWILKYARHSSRSLYPAANEQETPVAYLWARTIRCSNPQCALTIPLIRQSWLSKKSKRNIAFRLVPDALTQMCRCQICEGKDITFDPTAGTIRRGKAACPACGTVIDGKQLQIAGAKGDIGEQLLIVVTDRGNGATKYFRLPCDVDFKALDAADHRFAQLSNARAGSLLPQEPLKPWSGVFNAPLFGLSTWGALFNPRQAVVLTEFARLIGVAGEKAAQQLNDDKYGTCLATCLTLILGKMLDYDSTLCSWHNTQTKVAHQFTRQALPMIWDYAETNIFSGIGWDWKWAIDWQVKFLVQEAGSGAPATVQRASVLRLPFSNSDTELVVTDPPYYDAVPYSDLSDFFYVWFCRILKQHHPQVFSTPVTPKSDELVSHLGTSYPGKRKTAHDYESGMEKAFAEIQRTLPPDGVCAVMFSHKSTVAWETLIAGLNGAGFVVTSSWPIHTEMGVRLRARESAALASSVTLICRKRTGRNVTGLWDDVRQELKQVANERLDFFWNQGIRGADFFISAIGPALSVFGKYERVTKLSGDAVTVGQFLDEVRALVTGYALTKILHTTHTATIDPESRFYVVWKWSYGDAKVPADESFKLAQALGIDTELMWDKSGVLDKSGENVQAVPVARRMKLKTLGEPAAGGAPASLIDVLHRLCAFREKGDTPGMTEFLARSGHARNTTLWLVAQAISEILPDGEKEKQLMQGLLNQREGLEEATRQKELF